MKLRILTEADCRSVLDMADAIDIQGEAFTLLASGRSVDGLRSFATSDEPPGVAIFNPCFLKNGGGTASRLCRTSTTTPSAACPVCRLW